jgi:hypothetical protein
LGAFKYPNSLADIHKEARYLGTFVKLIPILRYSIMRLSMKANGRRNNATDVVNKFGLMVHSTKGNGWKTKQPVMED